MGITTIVLGVIVIILIYVLYTFYVKKSSVLVTTASLKGSNTPITALSAPQSTRYAYGIWVYINTWSPNVAKTIFSRANNIDLYLDSDKATLKCKITQSPEPNPPQIITITDNFPIQKWVCVVISADGQFIDCYLDGKLMNSNKLKNPPKTPDSTGTAPVVLGSGFDAYVAGFTSWSGPIGPQEAWNSYLSGNGGNSVSRMFTSYNIDVSVMKDNVQQSKFTLL
jgi:hypothetical protein